MNSFEKEEILFEWIGYEYLQGLMVLQAVQKLYIFDQQFAGYFQFLQFFSTDRLKRFSLILLVRDIFPICIPMQEVDEDKKHEITKKRKIQLKLKNNCGLLLKFYDGVIKNVQLWNHEFLWLEFP